MKDDRWMIKHRGALMTTVCVVACLVFKDMAMRYAKREVDDEPKKDELKGTQHRDRWHPARHGTDPAQDGTRRIRKIHNGGHSGGICFNWHTCRVCGRPSPDIPFRWCNFCPERPSWHHGRCCPGLDSMTGCTNPAATEEAKPAATKEEAKHKADVEGWRRRLTLSWRSLEERKANEEEAMRKEDIEGWRRRLEEEEPPTLPMVEEEEEEEKKKDEKGPDPPFEWWLYDEVAMKEKEEAEAKEAERKRKKAASDKAWRDKKRKEKEEEEEEEEEVERYMKRTIKERLIKRYRQSVIERYISEA